MSGPAQIVRQPLLWLLAAMYTVQSTLGALTFQGMPAVLRDAGVSQQQIGLVFLLMLPWVLKFLWAAPFERWRYRQPRATRQTFLLGNLAAVAGLLMLTLLDPGHQFVLVFAGLALIALVTATVDVAIDGFAIGQADQAQRSWVNVMQIGGGYTGAILGGGVFLILIGQISWQLALCLMAALLMLLVLPLLRADSLRAPRLPRQRPTLRAALGNPQLRWGLLIVVLSQGGLRLVQGMSMPFMVDHGLSLTELGVIATFGSSLTSLLAVFGCGLLIRRYGCWPVLRGMLLVQLVLYSAFWHFSNQPQLTLLEGAALLLLSAAASAAAFVALYTLMMECTSPLQAGVDFTLLQCMDSAVALCAGVLSGVLVQQLGYSQYFLVAVIATLLAVVAVPWLYRPVTAKEAVL